MRCAWNELMAVLPLWIREQMNSDYSETAQEIRLRIHAPPEIVSRNGCCWLEGKVCEDDLTHIIHTTTRYSPWTAASASQGYITASGGHRIGMCGEAVCKNGIITGIHNLRSLCIRIARDFSGIAGAAGEMKTSMLILGAPGTGKTTLLRDLIRKIAETSHVCVVDERCELFPSGFQEGKFQDTLTGCPKCVGIEMLLRAMGPDFIAVDEITAEQDCQALVRAACCGVNLLATAHAGNLEDYYQREVYRPLREKKLFQTALVLHRNKTFTVERMRM